MTRRLLLAVSPGEIWVALAENEALVGLRLIRTVGVGRNGDIYLGRVVGSLPNIDAKSIEIGLARPAFLAAKHFQKGVQLTDGQAILVEIVKEARADKPTAVSMKLSRSVGSTDVLPPLLLDRRDTPLSEALTAFSEPDEILIDDAGFVAQARNWLKQHRPALADKVRYHNEIIPLFDAFGLGAAIEATLSPRVNLPKGGAIIIETTAAATLIDVDSGGASPLAANLAAAREIARQIALRDLAGAIVIDFIGMKRPEDKARVRAAFLEAMGGDGDAQFFGWTRLGHFELTRRRRRAALAELLYETAPGGEPMKQSLTIALEALHALQRETRAGPGKRFGLRVHAEIAASLAGPANGAVRDLEAALGIPIAVTAEARPRDSFALAPV